MNLFTKIARLGYMHSNEELIKNALKYENLSSSAIAKATGISQPTVSRTLKKLPVIKVGAGRNTVFALVEQQSPEPLYKINKIGNITCLGHMHHQPQNRILLIQESKHISYEGLPFYFYDAIPSGFLGSIHLKHIVKSDQKLTTKSQDWSAQQVLHYMTNYGEDLTGNLVLGNAMAEKAANKNYPVVTREDYSYIANSINQSPENLGSSIAGEQPKFTLYNGKNHLIIKYSPPILEDNPVATRHRDLLICEHLALQALDAANIKASKTHLHIDDRIYLEIERFDRIGLHGRKGMVSLKYIDAEYTDLNKTWPEIASALLNKRLITEETLLFVETAYAFGKYTANTDMHNGNFSLFLDDLQISTPTPIYDMLPMAYMPVQGELRNPELKAPRFIQVSNKANQNALTMAKTFWSTVINHSAISQDFKKTIKPYVEDIKNYQIN